MSKFILLAVTILKISFSTFGQNYSVAMCHSHNDYEHKIPFYEAFNLGFGSIEADVYLINNELYVAHEKAKIDSSRTLKKLYIDPILTEIQKNKGKLNKPLQLLIDLKTGDESMKAIENQLLQYKSIFKKAKVNIVISGEMPKPSEFVNYDEMFTFDGRINTEYSKAELKRIKLFSESFLNVVKWDGKSQLADDQLEKLEIFVKKIHKMDKKLRFWATPDTPTSWTTLMNLGLDYIGTDDLNSMAKFLK